MAALKQSTASEKEGATTVVIIIYFILLVVIIGFFTTFYCFVKFFASFMGLILTTIEAGRERRVGNFLTGGFGPMWRVLRDNGNAHASKVLFRNMGLLFGSLAITMGAALFSINLEAKYCVLGMTKISPNGTVTSVCNSSKENSSAAHY